MICKGDRIIIGEFAVLVMNEHEQDEKNFVICNVYMIIAGKYRSKYEKVDTITVGIQEFEKLRRDRDIHLLNALMN